MRNAGTPVIAVLETDAMMVATALPVWLVPDIVRGRTGMFSNAHCPRLITRCHVDVIYGARQWLSRHGLCVGPAVSLVLKQSVPRRKLGLHPSITARNMERGNKDTWLIAGAIIHCWNKRDKLTSF